MIRILLITLFLLINTQARENPFFPMEGEKDIPYTSNLNKKTPKLKRATITLPSQARVIKKVTIEYENLDASQETKSIELDNTVDWHLPIFISQSYTEQPTERPIVKKRIVKKATVKKSTVKKSISKKSPPKKVIAKETSTEKLVEKKTTGKYKNIAQIEYAKFFAFEKNLEIVTNDELLRDFLLVQPHRIVMDFKRESSMKTYLQNVKNSIFTKIRIGNHDGYYRVVVELDGYYRYKLKKLSSGCLITLQ